MGFSNLGEDYIEDSSQAPKRGVSLNSHSYTSNTSTVQNAPLLLGVLIYLCGNACSDQEH